ncbi:MAG: molybdopterin molybdenumtransferase MoeA [Verrucomicrobiaceae bacterium]|nr:MAG: molybdopterin molybdenumtransferase MoeA [Verrucomicrobiaceae bacterium]
MLEESEARRRILSLVPAPAAVELPLEKSVGRYAARDLFATLALPPCANSAMDGYALHAVDCGKAPHTVRIQGEQPAGPDRGLAVRPGGCVRIFTGAPLPADTAAVIMQEDTALFPDLAEVSILTAADPGEFIRAEGSDLCAGQKILNAGDRITPQRLSLLAGQGLTSVPCGRAPRVHVLTTGDELIPAGQPLTVRGCIHNSNGPMLRALAAQAGAESGTSHAPDRLDILTDSIRRALEDHDVLVLAGGVSVGDHDLVKPALESLGISLEFWRIRLKPGKPFLFTRHGGKLIFGLPGNPVSAFVTAVLFLLPALRRFAGASMELSAPLRARATLTMPAANKGDRPHYLRGVFDFPTGGFTPLGLQQSHATGALAAANALLRLEPETDESAGSVQQVILF